MGNFKSNRRVEGEFVSSQILGLDLDSCPLSIDELESRSEFIQEYALLMYPTPSSTLEQPKTRVLFVLTEPVEGDNAAKRWRAMQSGLIEHFFELEPDSACKDPARLFYGCNTKEYYVNYNAYLPLDVAGALVKPQAELEEFSRTEARYAVSRGKQNPDALAKLVYQWLNTGINNLSNVAAGERHNAFVRYATWLYGLNKGGWPISIGDIESALKGVAASWGSSESDAVASLKWSLDHATPIGTEQYQTSMQGKRASLYQRMSRYRSNENG